MSSWTVRRLDRHDTPSRVVASELCVADFRRFCLCRLASEPCDRAVVRVLLHLSDA